MRVCVVTRDEAVEALVREGIKDAEVDVFPDSNQFIDCITLPPEIPRFVFIDITTIADGVRATDFIKSSPSIAGIIVVAIAHAGQAEQIGWQPDAVLFYPFTSAEVNALVTRMRLQR